MDIDALSHVQLLSIVNCAALVHTYCAFLLQQLYNIDLFLSFKGGIRFSTCKPNS
jgi:hypothetical protein